MAKEKTWKVKLNASTTAKQHVAGIGDVEPGKWIDLDDRTLHRFETKQRAKITDMVGGVFEIKDPDGNLLKLPDPKEETESTTTSKESE